MVTTGAVAMGLAVALATPAAAADNFTFRADYCTGESSVLYVSGKNLHPGDRYALYQTELPGSESFSSVVEPGGRVTLELALLAAEFDNGRTITAQVALIERNGTPVQAAPIASFEFGARCTLVTGKVTVAGKAAESLTIQAIPWIGKSFDHSGLDDHYVYGLIDGSYRLRLKPGTTYTLRATAFRATETFLGGGSTLPRTPTERNSFKVGTSETTVDTIRMNQGPAKPGAGGGSGNAEQDGAAPSVKAAQKVLSTARTLAKKAKTAAEKKASSKAVSKAKTALKSAKVAKKAVAKAKKAGSVKAKKMAAKAANKATEAKKAATRALKSARKALR